MNSRYATHDLPIVPLALVEAAARPATRSLAPAPRLIAGIPRTIHLLLALFMAIAFAQVQTFTTLKSFGDLANVTGVQRYSNLVQGPGGTLYGTAFDGPENVRGTVFKLNSDGSGFTAIKWFTNSAERAFPAPASPHFGVRAFRQSANV